MIHLPICPHCASDNVKQNVCIACKKKTNHSNDVNSLQPGTILHKNYIIGKQLGSGGFGITYLARDMTLGRPVAVKEYLPKRIAARSDDMSTVEPTSTDLAENYRYGMKKFLEEARTLAEFDDKRIARVLTCFEENGTAYFCMPYYEGISLDKYVVNRKNPIPEEELLDIFFTVLDGLSIVHKNKKIHRDIKPANIYMPTLGKYKSLLIDFGAARQAIMDQEEISVLLTPGYAPIEQYSAHGQLGTYTDIYACAASMYACLCGEIKDGKLKPPLSAPNRADGKELVHISEASNTPVNPGVAEAIMHGLAMEPAARPQSVLEFKQMLKRRTPERPVESASLHCIAGEYSGQSLPLSENPIIVGRSSAMSNLVIPANIVSKKHCQVCLINKAIKVKDLGSKNGTFLDEVRLSSQKEIIARPGQILSIAGHTLFRLEAKQTEKKDLLPQKTPVSKQELDETKLSMQPTNLPWIFRLFTPRGRLNRLKYFIFLLIVTAVTTIGNQITIASFAGRVSDQKLIETAIIWSVVQCIFTIFPAIKRLHDLDRPGDNIFLFLIPIYNIYLGLLLLFKPGDEGHNKYGPNPIGKNFFETI